MENYQKKYPAFRRKGRNPVKTLYKKLLKGEIAQVRRKGVCYVWLQVGLCISPLVLDHGMIIREVMARNVTPQLRERTTEPKQFVHLGGRGYGLDMG
jgi:hypothetical protein